MEKRTRAANCMVSGQIWRILSACYHYLQVSDKNNQEKVDTPFSPGYFFRHSRADYSVVGGPFGLNSNLTEI